MIGHQILLGLSNENFHIHTHFKSKKPEQDFFKSKNTIPHFFEITALNIDDFLTKINPDIIINAAGVTIRRANESSINQIIFVNSLLPNILNKWAEKNNCRLIHFSTDCVFSGSKGGYVESDFKELIYIAFAGLVLEPFIKTQIQFTIISGFKSFTTLATFSLLVTSQIIECSFNLFLKTTSKTSYFLALVKVSYTTCPNMPVEPKTNTFLFTFSIRFY